MVSVLMKKLAIAAVAGAVMVSASGCSLVTSGKRIIRVSHAQSETHPEHLGMLAFKEYVEEHLGDKYEVQIFPNEILGSAQKAIELTQTGAIDFVIAGTANLETFADVYEIFSMPYLFDSEEVYRSVMEDTDYMENIYKSTDEAGFSQPGRVNLLKTRGLDYILSLKLVDSVDEAIRHINTYNTGHSETIVTSDYFNAQTFLNEVDAAAVYVNASTRFTDGEEFGFGAEIGISTQKLHARGPMGLKELTTTKYIIYGDGQIR